MSFIIFKQLVHPTSFLQETGKKKTKMYNCTRTHGVHIICLWKKCAESNRDVRVMHVLQLSSFHKISELEKQVR